MDSGHPTTEFTCPFCNYLMMATNKDKKETIETPFGSVIQPEDADFENKTSTPFGDAVTPDEIDLQAINSLMTDFGEVVIPSEAELRENFEFINPDANSTIKSDNGFSDSKYSAYKLFKMPIGQIPMLIEPIFPKQGLVSLIGSSDTGKSTFLRQMALSIALGLNDFVGYPLKPKTKNVIFISTEDDPASLSSSIKKSLAKLFQKYQLNESDLNHLKFYFDVDMDKNSDKNLIKLLNKDLSEKGADLIIIDAFTDIFSEDINSSTKVRTFLNLFSKLAKEYECLVLFLHHTGKRTNKYASSKDNALGSQAFEAKMRVLLELKQHPDNDMQRTLTIAKGNYISTEIKKHSKVLDFDEQSLLFSDTGKPILTSSLFAKSKTLSKKDKMLPIVWKLFNEGKTIRETTEILNAKGYSIKKSTVGNYLKELKAENQ